MHEDSCRLAVLAYIPAFRGVLLLPVVSAANLSCEELSNDDMHDDVTSVQVYLEAFDELDDPCNSQQPKQLLNA